MNAEIKKHWETIYQTKQPNEVSWTEEKPSVSLDIIHSFNPSKSAKIIDIGGGDSKLVDYLLAEGFSDLSVLDISEVAIDRAKNISHFRGSSRDSKWLFYFAHVYLRKTCGYFWFIGGK